MICVAGGNKKEHCCNHYRHKNKGVPKCPWGSSMLKRLMSKARAISKKNKISTGLQRLPWTWDIRLDQIHGDWIQVAVKFLRLMGLEVVNWLKSLRVGQCKICKLLP